MRGMYGCDALCQIDAPWGRCCRLSVLILVANAELLQLDVDVRLNADLLRVALEGGALEG